MANIMVIGNHCTYQDQQTQPPFPSHSFKWELLGAFGVLKVKSSQIKNRNARLWNKVALFCTLSLFAIQLYTVKPLHRRKLFLFVCFKRYELQRGHLGSVCGSIIDFLVG